MDYSNHPDILLEKVDELLKNEDFEEALNILEQIRENNKKNKSIKQKLIKALFSYGFYLTDELISKDQEAIAIFQRIIELDPENYKAFYNLGITYENLEMFEKALKNLKKALEINPEHKFSYYNIGLIYETQERLEDALGFYNKALEIDPKFLYARHARNAVRDLIERNENSGEKKKSSLKKDLRNFGLRFEEIEQLKTLLKMSEKVRIEMIKEMLGLEQKSFYDLLLYLGNNYDFVIDGDYLIIHKEGLGTFLEDL